LGGNDRKHYFTGRQNCNSAIIPNTKRNSNSRESPHVSAVFVTAAFWAGAAAIAVAIAGAVVVAAAPHPAQIARAFRSQTNLAVTPSFNRQLF
jgi:hypothetical protein